jgi:hypothetical protein
LRLEVWPIPIGFLEIFIGILFKEYFNVVRGLKDQPYSTDFINMGRELGKFLTKFLIRFAVSWLL